MKYFNNNVELAKIYKVSEKSIRNWIKAAQANKIPIQLYNDGERNYILNTSANDFVMKDLALKAKKYKNKKSFKTVEPQKKFYELFNHNQIVDIIRNLEVYKEIFHQYGYFDEGIDFWEKYTYKMLKEKEGNNLVNTIELLNTNIESIYSLIKNYDGVNIIDIGVGNGMPANKLVEALKSKSKFNKYIGIDASQGMLDLAKKNLETWFPEGINFEGYVKDMNFDKFEDILFDNVYVKTNKKLLNLILVLGSTHAVQRFISKPLETVKFSMGTSDLFLCTAKLDTPKTRRYFDFSTDSSDSMADFIQQERVLLNMLNIDESFYNIKPYFSEVQNSRIISIELKVDLQINFDFDGFHKEVFFNNSDNIVVWRAEHQTYEDVIKQFSKLGFEILHTSRSSDQEEMLIISKIKLS
jgi:uncharacterized SAM-dependent methyltransferase